MQSSLVSKIRFHFCLKSLAFPLAAEYTAPVSGANMEVTKVKETLGAQAQTITNKMVEVVGGVLCTNRYKFKFTYLNLKRKMSKLA